MTATIRMVASMMIKIAVCTLRAPKALGGCMMLPPRHSWISDLRSPVKFTSNKSQEPTASDLAPLLFRDASRVRPLKIYHWAVLLGCPNSARNGSLIRSVPFKSAFLRLLRRHKRCFSSGNDVLDRDTSNPSREAWSILLTLSIWPLPISVRNSN